MIFYRKKFIRCKIKFYVVKINQNFMLIPKEKGGNLTVKKNFKFVYA